jgi:hypothetical protein
LKKWFGKNNFQVFHIYFYWITERILVMILLLCIKQEKDVEVLHLQEENFAAIEMFEDYRFPEPEFLNILKLQLKR